MITATVKQLQATFTEWDRRYREHPEEFMSEAARLLKCTPESYGEECVPYFLEILGQVKVNESIKETSQNAD